MGYSARTLVEAIADPAALAGADGRILVANSRWVRAAERDAVCVSEGGGFRPAARACPGHEALHAAVRLLGPGDAPVELPCRCRPSGEVLVRVAPVTDGHGEHQRLVSIIRVAPGHAGPPAEQRDGPDRPRETGTMGGAESLSRAKSEFLALLGHEIRTPVTGVVAMIDLLRALPLAPEVREVVDGVHRSTHALQSLTDDLLDLARMETGRLELEERPTALRTVLEDVIEPLQQQARQKGLLLLATTSPDLPPGMMVDPQRLRQVLTKVAGNAIKFTERGEVVLSAARTGAGRVLISVRDTGPGLDEFDRERLFAPFVQSDSSSARHHEGAGLGLAIAGRLVARMGGAIEVVSECGRGSEFKICLPLVPVGLAETDEPEGWAPLAGRRIAVVAPSPWSTRALVWLLASVGAEAVPASLAEVTGGACAVDSALWCDDSHDPAAVDRAETVIEAMGSRTRAVMISTTDPRRGLVTRPAIITAPLTRRRLVAALNSERTGVRGAPITVPQLPGGRVLLAEDNEVNRDLLRRMIEVLGVECDAVGDGAAAAAAALGDRPYDVILMDVQMPGTDGLEATRRIRAAGVRTPIVALTATALQGDQERCLAAGMDDHLGKPIGLPVLHAALQRYLCPAPAAPGGAGREPDAPSVDLSRLHELEEQLGDRTLVLTTVHTFLNQLEGRRVALSEALKREDRDGLRAAAHTLKSSSALLGADGLASACDRVERRAAAKAASPELASLVAELEQTVTGTVEAMAGYIAEAGRLG